jgi:hypothetical protein
LLQATDCLLVTANNSQLATLLLLLLLLIAEESVNVNYPEYAMDIAYDVNNCKVNTADYWTRDPIRIPFNHLRKRPCDLRITLSPQLPVKK